MWTEFSPSNSLFDRHYYSTSISYPSLWRTKGRSLGTFWKSGALGCHPQIFIAVIACTDYYCCDSNSLSYRIYENFKIRWIFGGFTWIILNIKITTAKKEFASVNMQLSSFDSATLLLIWRDSGLLASLISEKAWYVSLKKWRPKDGKVATFK